ncbi:hypothetical protein HCN44_003182 [Aphidius gifuensis]|uniref:Ionotropic receptor n=2 Tax=Aphidius gifuensis TaxID=684658 RepID=A0A3Q9EJV0_APHGI|nr:scavenger receptor class B member 1-like isoform X1 [Aphidius gifuensis]XP_044018510.1 scavenger receptor class B member 1-like isoform X1 [Aphidius gifuensis]XP_044018511.1 scavenger receptor class B member 1-like isoform X1 [Aphidius gifuensis]AZQ24972.1 ionotropic receptor [Aphidius gifuensis]KAF7987420.1 hypothetical protein HCN44_003182 [Aphidius gifuensis]
MKTSAEFRQFKRCIILFMVSILCCSLAFAIYIIDPVKLIFQWKLTMTPTSTAFLLWQKPPIGVFLNVYIFNITNKDEFMNGQEKLRVDEIGPYVYQEILENANVHWNDNGTISYTPRRTIIFKPELSVNNPEVDNIYVPNIPMLGVSSALRNAGFIVNYPLAHLANILNSQPILKMTVHEYLWGYDDSLVRLAAGIIPNFVNFKKFGLLDRMYDEGENVVNININSNDDMANEEGRYLSIQNYNGSPGLPNWGYVKPETNKTNSGNTFCNQIKGATEGSLFPTHMDKNAVFRVFRKAFCRTLPIVFKKEVVSSGLKGYEYSLSDNFLDTPDNNPDNECYCRKMSKCLKKGLSDLTPCYYNIPAAISLPHFLYADQSLVDGVEGLHPDPEKHLSSIIIQPDVGAPIDVHSKLQTNLVMDETVYNPKIKVFNNLVIPLFWTDLTIPPETNEILFLMKLLLNIAPIAQTSFIYLLIISGILTFFLSLFGVLWIIKQSEQQMNDERRDSADLRIPLGYGQYTAIHILPVIKKMTSRTELFG